MPPRIALCLLPLLAACGKGTDPETRPTTLPSTTDTSTTTTTEPLPSTVTVTVTLDGAPGDGVAVQQAGSFSPVIADASGVVTIDLDPAVVGDPTIVASHPDARVKGWIVDGPTGAIELFRFSLVDNTDFPFEDPGSPTDNLDNSKCAHCHITINEDWYGSMHRTAASNPHVQDTYAGTAALSQSACVAAGGQWWSGIEPGTLASVDKCYLGAGTLPDLNPSCGDTGPCDGVATETGACADCHAPGIDGVVGGRDLHDATGFAYDYGVHCDVCHSVESTDLSGEAGVAGFLKILRSSDPDDSPGFEYTPLTFGPFDDVANPKMGSVQRAHYQDTTLCAGCHQLDQPVLVPGQSIDTARWPNGRLPIHGTWAEWLAGPMNPGAPCQSCHMPPDPDVGNAADLYNVFDAPLGESVATGWPRPPGSVRRHVWVGPRSPDIQDMLGLAAQITLTTSWDATEWVVDAEVSNVGPGHAIPTGEPSRQILLAVEADCSGTPLVPTGGDVLPDYAGYLARQDATGDWTDWPGAQVGERIRVVALTGAMREYDGPGSFGIGQFAPADKGLPEEVAVGERTITAINGSTVTLDAPLPAGDVAYRVPIASLPSDGAPISPLAGAPGFGFAKVLVDANGTRMVPHHAAVDVVSDNRIKPQQSWTSTHRFDGAACPNPTVRAVLVHRAFPWSMASEKAWSVTESVMAEVTQ